ncbi:LysR family transcriptional regulator [Amycolatopsis sp. NPDC059021]|uniref:LysR family transcriptional regulator n=1 Tax=Amycolatopsis sp. NPDC059021 TaxID=3346704 RepID=UPI00366CA66D
MDLNLLTAFDALLREGSVTGAAERLGLSKPAMSRALGRLRRVLRDPVLTRAGRGMVLSPLALEMAPRVHALVEEATSLLSTGHAVDLSTLERTFAVRANETLVAHLGGRLLGMIAAEAPSVRLRFVAEGDEDVRSLRDGTVDLDIGVIGETGPEIHVEPLLRDDVVFAVRPGHPLTRGDVTWKRLAAFPHISISRRGRIGETPAQHGAQVVAVVPAAPAAVYLLRDSDAVALMSRQFAGKAGLAIVEPPQRVRALPISLAWHPRLDADPAHRWLRACVRRVCEELS